MVTETLFQKIEELEAKLAAAEAEVVDLKALETKLRNATRMANESTKLRGAEIKRLKGGVEGDTKEARSMKTEPDWMKEWERRSRRRMRVCVGSSLIAFACLIATLVLGAQAKGDEFGIGTCLVSEATSTALWYVPNGVNTEVILIAHCPGLSTAWYLSFFTGEQPSLWDWYGIQNAAGILLREGDDVEDLWDGIGP